MKPITPSIHTVVDVLFCVAMALAPSLLGFGGLPATLCYAVAGSYFVFSMLTNTPVAPIKLVPFRVHGMVEIVAGLGLLGAPWLLHFDNVERAKWLFVGAGVVTFVVFALTQWREAPSGSHARSYPA